MKLQVSYHNASGEGVSTAILTPDECSVCRKLVVWKFLNGACNPARNELHFILGCPNPECRSLIRTVYNSDASTLLKFDPPPLLPKAVSESISQVSPDFVSIHLEASEAKVRGLSQIAGPGYRKAFEFLIKDYAKSLAPPEQHEKIEKTFAGKVVDEFIQHPRIKELAKRALWLGNDETHYLRKWQEHDINDLIALIDLTIHWIEIELQSQIHLKRMPEGK